MNLFKITKTEYQQNFGEKNFLKSLIYPIFKGNETPSKIEDTIINQVIVEYYNAFLHSSKGFSTSKKKKLRHCLLLKDKKNEKYEKYSEKVENRYYRTSSHSKAKTNYVSILIRTKSNSLSHHRQITAKSSSQMSRSLIKLRQSNRWRNCTPWLMTRQQQKEKKS